MSTTMQLESLSSVEKNRPQARWLVACCALLMSLHGCGCQSEPVPLDAGAMDASTRVDVETGDAAVPESEWDAGPPPDVRTTGCWSVSAVAARQTEASFGRVVALPNGEALVVWLGLNRSERWIAAQHFSPDGGRGPQHRLAQSSSGAFKPARVVSNSMGDVVVLWESTAPAGDRLEIARRSSAGDWSPSEVLHEGRAWEPRVALTATGEAFVAYFVSEEGFTSLVLRRRIGSAWLPREVLSPQGFQVQALSLAASEVAVLSWTQWGPPTFEPSANAVVWQDGVRRDTVVQRIRRGVGPTSLDTVVVSGRQALAVLAVSATEYDVVALAENRWEPVSRLSEQGQTVPSFGVDAEGRFAVWWTLLAPDGGFSVEVRRQTDAGWSPLMPIASQTEPTRGLAVASNARGTAGVVWARGGSLVASSRWPDGGSALDTLDGLSFGGDLPGLAVATSGDQWLAATTTEPGRRLVLLHCPPR
jgi:hypothetical protein